MKSADTNFILWFKESNERRFLFGEAALRKAAKSYDFSADDVLRFGEVEFDEDDGNGAFGGCCIAKEDKSQ